MLPALERPEHFPDLHASINVYIRDWLAPRLPDRYNISVERGLSMTNGYGETQRFRPDLRIDETLASSAAGTATAMYEEPTFVVELPREEQRLLTLRDSDNNLVTTIEVLSPANKSSAGFERFKNKQSSLAERGVNLIEIDLLRDGARRVEDDRVARADYVVTVQRGGERYAQVWATPEGKALPTFPVPLRYPDADLPLPLEGILREFLTKSGLGRRLGVTD